MAGNASICRETQVKIDSGARNLAFEDLVGMNRSQLLYWDLQFLPFHKLIVSLTRILSFILGTTRELTLPECLTMLSPRAFAVFS